MQQLSQLNNAVPLQEKLSHCSPSGLELFILQVLQQLKQPHCMQRAFQTRRNTNYCKLCARKRLFSRNGRRISSEMMAHTAAAAVAAQQHTLFVAPGVQGRPLKPSCATARYLCSLPAHSSHGHSHVLHLKFWV